MIGQQKRTQRKRSLGVLHYILMVSRLTPGVFYYKIRPFAYIYICAYIGDYTMRQKCSGREKQSATMIWLLALALWVRPPRSCSISLWGVWKELGKSKKKHYITEPVVSYLQIMAAILDQTLDGPVGRDMSIDIHPLESIRLSVL